MHCETLTSERPRLDGCVRQFLPLHVRVNGGVLRINLSWRRSCTNDPE